MSVILLEKRPKASFSSDSLPGQLTRKSLSLGSGRGFLGAEEKEYSTLAVLSNMEMGSSMARSTTFVASSCEIKVTLAEPLLRPSGPVTVETKKNERY